MSQPLPKFATAATLERSTVDMAADRPILERSDLVLACAHVLHRNGQSTHLKVEAAEWLGAAHLLDLDDSSRGVQAAGALDAC